MLGSNLSQPFCCCCCCCCSANFVFEMEKRAFDNFIEQSESLLFKSIKNANFSLYIIRNFQFTSSYRSCWSFDPLFVCYIGMSDERDKVLKLVKIHRSARCYRYWASHNCVYFLPLHDHRWQCCSNRFHKFLCSGWHFWFERFVFNIIICTIQKINHEISSLALPSMLSFS